MPDLGQAALVIDAGGTSVKAVYCPADSLLQDRLPPRDMIPGLASQQFGPGNLETLGETGLATRVGEILQWLSTLGRHKADLSQIELGIGMAGLRTDESGALEDQELVTNVFASKGFSPERTIVRNDADWLVFTEMRAAALISGTGSHCVIKSGEHFVRSGGLGANPLRDRGSGFFVGEVAVTMAVELTQGMSVGDRTLSTKQLKQSKFIKVVTRHIAQFLAERDGDSSDHNVQCYYDMGIIELSRRRLLDPDDGVMLGPDEIKMFAGLARKIYDLVDGGDPFAWRVLEKQAHVLAKMIKGAELRLREALEEAGEPRSARMELPVGLQGGVFSGRTGREYLIKMLERGVLSPRIKHHFHRFGTGSDEQDPMLQPMSRLLIKKNPDLSS